MSTSEVHWSIGIDPGFGQTGLVLVHGEVVKEWAVLSCPPNGSPLMRTIALANAVHDCLEDWVNHYCRRVKEIDVAIETPVYTKNAYSFELQWRLVQEIESVLTSIRLGNCITHLTEVGPTTSKRLAAGSGGAKKADIAERSPFRYQDFPGTKAGRDTCETLADAWAHSLATWGRCDTCRRLTLDWTDEPEVTVDVGPR